MDKKLKLLKEVLTEMESVLVAYSGGVDSTFLLKVAKDALDNKVVAATASSLTYPSCELENAKKIVEGLGISHLVITTDELSSLKFTNNLQDRCYWCKRELFSRLSYIAKKEGLRYVADGTNFGDTKDFRPGMKAAREFKIRNPLKEARLTKEDIRKLSKKLNLPTWNKPSLACLASRFPYGTKITRENLAKVDTAEGFLRNFGITQVRVRHHNQIARIEVLKDEIPKLLEKEVKEKIVSKFKELGYVYVTVDLAGYRTGSMNEVLK